MWGSWTPAKVKMAVSGCPRNCAEATCKDVGVVCVDSGYDIHFAGAAGLDIKGTEVLGHVEDGGRGARTYRRADAALSRAGPLSRAHLQMGQARRPSTRSAGRSWTTPRSARPISTASSSAQKFAQVDPWAERVAGKDKHEFRPMADDRLCGGGGVRNRMKLGSTIGTTLRHSPAGRALRRDARRQDRRVPHRRRSGLRARGPLPAQGRSAEPGHRARERGHVPAAQLGDHAGDRQGAGRRRRLGPHPSRSSSTARRS